MPAIVAVLAFGWQPSAPREAATASERHARKAAAIANMNAGEHEAAQAEFHRMISNPQSPLDAVDGRRMMAMSLRMLDEAHAADVMLTEAIKALDTVAEDATTVSLMRGTILMDQADLAAFSLDEPARAIALYDTAVAIGLSDRDALIAMRNAAILAAKIGKYSDACRRVDLILASPVAASLPAAERIGLRYSQAAWHVSNGDLGRAELSYRAIWDGRAGNDFAEVAMAGAQCISWMPPQTHCKELSAMATDLFAFVDRLRTSASRDTADRALINAAEAQAARRVIDAADCADATLNSIARSRLNEAAQPAAQ
ncbi:MAG: hypothetical protein NTV94_13165 [Planctomycetota bacterium]|nr:hypothetical protein [Planctomycetota bacterium]